MLLALGITAAASAGTAIFDLGEFDEMQTAYTCHWYTDGLFDVSTDLTLEMLQNAIEIRFEFKREPSERVTFFYMGDGCGWAWKTAAVFGPEQGTTFVVDIASLDDWALAMSGFDGQFGFFYKNLPDILSAVLVYRVPYTTADALTILRVAAGLQTATPEEISRLDMDGNGALTTADALTILRVVAGIE
jgi:hypothetical protein